MRGFTLRRITKSGHNPENRIFRTLTHLQNSSNSVNTMLQKSPSQPHAEIAKTASHANSLGLPPGRVYAVLSYQSVGSGVSTLTTLFSTRDASAFEDVLATVKREQIGKPKLRITSFGNCREVGVMFLDGTAVAEGYFNAGHMPELPRAGQTYRSVKLTAAALGLSPNSLREYFARARKAAGGRDDPFTVRGVRIAYTDTPAWAANQGLIQTDAPKANSFAASSIGKRLTRQEMGALMKNLESQAAATGEVL